MKNPKLTLIIPLFLALGTYVQAEDGVRTPDAPPPPPPAKRGADILKKFDKDGDGKLSDEEKAAAKEAMKDKKGEKPEGRPEGRPGVPPEILKKFDKDGDGKLSDEERAAAGEEFKKNREEDMKKHDKNGDGKLDEAERLEAFKARLEANPEMKAKITEKFDENKDGTLSDEEIKKAVGAFGGKGRGPGSEGPPGKEGKGEPRRIPGAKGKDAPKGAN